MKTPVVLAAFAAPDSYYAQVTLTPLRNHGFVAEAVGRWELVNVIRRLSLSPAAEAPDVILLAPEEEPYPLNYRSGLLTAWTVVEEIRSLPDASLLPGRVRARTMPIVLAAYGRGLFYHSERPFTRRWFEQAHSPDQLVIKVEEGHSELATLLARGAGTRGLRDHAR